MQSAAIFPDVLEIHHDLLSFIPQEIPEAEQSYYLANIYSLLLEQDKNKGTKAPILSVKNQTDSKSLSKLLSKRNSFHTNGLLSK